MMSDMFISGQWVAASGEAMDSIDPSYGQTIWTGRSADRSDVDKAMRAAEAAFEGWSQTPLSERIAILKRFAEIAASKNDELGRLIALETGKALWDATGEAGVVGAKAGVTLTAYEERTGTRTLETGFGRAELVHRPHGVMAVLGPYNFPAHLPNGQILPALLAGNTVVFKPSELTPKTGAFLMDLYHAAGFPPGVINLVQGSRATGEALLAHEALAGVLFVGSAPTGAAIHKQFGGRPDILLALEMGGNNPLIAWDVSDPQAAASHIVQSAFITTGQRCTCARRIILPTGKSGDAIVDAIIAATEQIKIGAWDDDGIFMGPLISADIAGKVAGMAKDLPGKTLKSMQRMDRGGAYLSPGIVDVTGQSVKDEEIFAPNMQIIRVDNFDAAITRANATKFGLSAGLISDDHNNWDIFKSRIHAGVVNFNRPTTGASGALPFGGPGLSGNHNPGAYYSADFCAWPMSSQISAKVETVTAQGLPFKAS
ncbi:succinylglutamate-semialdehyde dehydrogenase [Robiginitomaculum antarcticum]|uniref:succinylglutamate-semialdehyde dehydrogenase n=1 Tax=Robiginitomaculum antarcticum TaxID=437507 RepID=UPI0012E9F61D